MLRFEYIAPDKLIPYAKNARKHSPEQVSMIAASIKEFGFTMPILVRDDMTLIAGHGRLEAAQKLGLKEVPIVKASHLSEAQARALVHVDNQIALKSTWDFDLLKLELDDIKFDFEPYEFDLPDVEVAPTAGLTDDDSVPEVEQNIHGVVLGDIWQLGEHRLMCGDSTNVQHVEKLMNGEKADMVFTDPPYGVDYKGINNDSRDGLESLIDLSLSNASLFSAKGAACYVFHSDRCADIFHSVYRKHCHFSSMLIWVKPALVLSRTDYQSQHEPCIYGWFNTGTHKWNGDRKQTSILNCGKEAVDGHTTPKPVELIQICISNSSKTGERCFDPFIGSGSTLIACEKTNRKCFGMELDPHYCSIIIERWQKFTGKKAERL